MAAAPLDPDRSYTGQSLFNNDADDDNEEGNAADDEGEQQRPTECAPKGPTPSFELVSEFFERIAEMRNVGAKRPAGGAAGVAQKKRALVEQMFKVPFRTWHGAVRRHRAAYLLFLSLNTAEMAKRSRERPLPSGPPDPPRGPFAVRHHSE